MKKFGLVDPSIVERGREIFIHREDSRFNTAETSTDNFYHPSIDRLECSYTKARAGFKVVQEEIGKILRGFGDMDEKSIRPLIGGTQQIA